MSKHVVVRIEESGQRHDCVYFDLEPGERIRIGRLNQTIYTTGREPNISSGTNGQEGANADIRLA